MESTVETKIIELVKLGHELAKELHCAESASLVSDLATQLDVQFARSNALAAENALMKQIIDSVTDLSNEPQYHSEGMGCGLEDRGITDRYEAMRHGWDEAMERIYGIAELEARTVTVSLPDFMPSEAAPAHYWGSGESMAYADGYNKSTADLKASFAQACSSAGVNVEFE